MKLALILLAGLSVVELGLWYRPLWNWRKGLSCVLVPAQAISVGLLFGFRPNVWNLLILIFSGYRVVNLLRLIEGRTQADYLARVARRTSWLLISLQLVTFGLEAISRTNHWTVLAWAYGFSLLALAGGLMAFSSTLRHLRTTRPKVLKAEYRDKDLPSLTVAIPARNETEDLQLCLESLIKSTYSKLEILVLDDCSQNKRTPQIIRNFAQAGIRFIKGQSPPTNWLAKNWAYQQLLDQASGELILFCGVDTRFEPDSLRLIVGSLLERKKSMISLQPRNQLTSRFGPKLTLQVNRYAWELSLPRRLLNRPPVLSTCWLAKVSDLKAHGEFKAVANSGSPESYFAKTAARTSDGYSFIRASTYLGLSCYKAVTDQLQTTVRTRYPQLHRRPELACLISLGELASLILPLVVAVYGLVNQHWLLGLVSLITTALVVSFYTMVMRLTYERFMLQSLMLLPLAVLLDVCLLNASMWQYEFRQVIWKGRNVCLPLMKINL